MVVSRPHRCRHPPARPAVVGARGHAARYRGHRAYRGRRPADADLHLWHHGTAEGRGAYALRLPHQVRAGHGPRLRRAAGRHHVLGERHRLDDGPVGAVRHDAPRRHRRALRRRARLPWARSVVGAGRAARREHPGRLAHAHPRADETRRGPVRAHDLSSLRILGSPASRGTPSRGAGSRRGRRRAPADHQLLGRHRSLGRAGGGQRHTALAGGLRRPAARHRGQTSWTIRPAGAQPGRRLSCVRHGSA